MTHNPTRFIIGNVLTAMAGLMLVTALFDIADGDPVWIAFVTSAVLTGFVGVGLSLASRSGGAPHLSLKQAFRLTVLAWVVIPCAATLPLLFVGMSFTDAFFEAMSGITTTGSTVLVGLDALPRGILMWRSLLQWIGGVGIIAMAILLLPFLRIGGMQLFMIESSATGDKAAATAASIVRNIIAIYVSLTVLCALLYYVFGMSAFDALCHAMTTLSTGGYSTHDASFSYFRAVELHWISTVFMLAGACPFIAYIGMARGNRGAVFRHPEVRRLVALLIGVSLSMALWLSWDGDLGFVDALRLTAFNFTSVVTTTGYASADYSVWIGPVASLVFILTFVGGCTGSTSGGLKIYRFQILSLMMWRHLQTLASPHRVVSITYQKKPVGNAVVFSVVAFMTAFFGAFVVVSLALSATGLDLITSLSGAATALANVGPGLGAVIGPAGNFASLPDSAKWILSLAMLLGRLELLAVLVMLNPDFWR